MQGNIGIWIECNHPVSVHLASKDDDEIEIIPAWNSKYKYSNHIGINSNITTILFSSTYLKPVNSSSELDVITW